jgi:hypothetical protein
MKGPLLRAAPIIEMGRGSRYNFFSFQVRVLMQTNTILLIIIMIFTL